MKRLFWVAPVVLFAVFFFRPAPALAGLHICNKTESKVYVAVAIMSGDCMFDWCNERVQGWWNIEAGDCKTPIGENLDTSGDTDYYFYAEDSGGTTWTGSLSLCVDPQNAFDYKDREEEQCTEGTHKNFQKIKTASYTDYTLSLTPT